MFRKAEMVYFLYRNKKKYTGLESGHLRKEQPRKSDVAVIAWIFQKTVTVSLISVGSLSSNGAVKPPNSILCGIHAVPGETTLFFDVSPVSLFVIRRLFARFFRKGAGVDRRSWILSDTPPYPAKAGVRFITGTVFLFYCWVSFESFFS